MDVDEFLEHHGVKGMRWGVRNDRTSTSSQNGNASSGMTPVKAVGIYVGTFLSVYGALRATALIESGEVTRKINKGKQFVKGQGIAPRWKTNPKLASHSLSEDEIFNSVVKPINPGFGGSGTKMNCRRCTYAYEMRRRGNDVESTRTLFAFGQDYSGIKNAQTPGTKKFLAPGPHADIRKNPSLQNGKVVIPMGKGDKDSVSKNIFSSLAKEPDGARGEVTVAWKAGGRHSVAWENVHGKTVIFDTQQGKKISNSETFAKTYKFAIKEAGYTRLDNMNLNEEFLMRWMKDA